MRNALRTFLFRLFRENEAKVHELNYLFWECTTRCNLRCRHCGSDCMSSSSDKDMPLEDFLAAIDTIPSKEIPRDFTVVLTGGEPLLRPDIEKVGDSIIRRGMGWGMVSNGFFYDEAMHAKLMGAGMGALTISLDGLEAEHDWMRGRDGSFERAKRAIAIAAADRRLNLDVVTCVNKKNIQQLQQIHDLLSGMRVKQWRIFTIIPIGRAKDDPDMHLTDDEFKYLMDFIQAKREHPESKMNVTFSCEGYLGKYETKVRQTPYICRAGLTIASILIDGRICACPNIDRDVFSQGSIYKDNFYDVWNHRFEAFRDRRWARKGMCKKCPVFKDCLGNGMHNWHGSCDEVINCHYHKTL
ncbi:MAG: TIGR04133 family radical SAM/SPASM protein [Bacteroidales bacterium]|nr:TIGR04133 family radical SAM/SPASM protein [Bacteroidales bacterium]